MVLVSQKYVSTQLVDSIGSQSKLFDMMSGGTQGSDILDEGLTHNGERRKHSRYGTPVLSGAFQDSRGQPKFGISVLQTAAAIDSEHTYFCPFS